MSTSIAPAPRGPFGDTIAHGLLVLSLIPAAHFELGVYPADASDVLNYGFERVRFLAPVPAAAMCDCTWNWSK